jgi:hypothetical protein
MSRRSQTDARHIRARCGLPGVPRQGSVRSPMRLRRRQRHCAQASAHGGPPLLGRRRGSSLGRGRFAAGRRRHGHRHAGHRRPRIAVSISPRRTDAAEPGERRSGVEGYGAGRYIDFDVATAMLSSSKVAERRSLPSEGPDSMKPALVCEAARRARGTAANAPLSARAPGLGRTEVAPGRRRCGRDAGGANFLARHTACAARSGHMASEAPVAARKFW